MIDHPLARVTPESVGIPSAAIAAFLDAVDRQVGGLHSLMLLRHGQVAAQGWWTPYGPERPHLLFSLSKSFTSTAVGLAVAEGRLSVDDPALPFFPNEAPTRISRNLAAMRVRHLLSMNTGHAEDTLGYVVRRRDGDWARAFLARPVTFEPGSHFLYNTGATYMLSAIIQRLTGQRLVDYLQPRLFDPLGIEPPQWETCPHGVNTGGWGLSLKTEDIARFGQLYLQKGLWQGQHVLPEAWVEEAIAIHSDNSSQTSPDWQQGYGYQFWRCRHGAYRGDGAFGQYCLVMPAQDAVLAITSGVADMQAVLDAIWAHLLPAMADAPLAASPAEHGALMDRLARLALAPAVGQDGSSIAERFDSKRIDFSVNEQGLQSIQLAWRPDGCLLHIRDRAGLHRVECGASAWREGKTTFESATNSARLGGGIAPRQVAASGAWLDDVTYVIRLCFFETPFHPTITLRFEGDRVCYRFEANAAFDALQRPALEGRLSQCRSLA